MVSTLFSFHNEALIFSGGRSGAPNPSFAVGMKNEHCKMPGYNFDFTTGNYGVRTTPMKEYEISTGKRECSMSDMLDRKGKLVRFIKSLDTLRDLELCTKAQLTGEEILAVVHSTPPP